MNPDGSDHKVIVTDCQFLDDGIAVDVRAGVHVAAAPAGGRGTQCNLAKRRVESLKVLAEERAQATFGAAFRKVRAGSLEGPFSQDVESEGRDRSLKIDSS